MITHSGSAYKTWLARQVCGCPGCGVWPVVLHHLAVWGLPRKLKNPVRDYVVVPLCPYHHVDGPYAAHRMKQTAWLTHWGMDADSVLLDQYRAYAAEHATVLPEALSAEEAARFLLSLEQG